MMFLKQKSMFYVDVISECSSWYTIGDCFCCFAHQYTGREQPMIKAAYIHVSILKNCIENLIQNILQEGISNFLS